MRVLLVLLAIAAIAAGQNDCYPANANTATNFQIGVSSTSSNQVCLGSCNQCVPTAGNTYGIYFTTNAGGQNIWKADIHVNDSASPPTITSTSGAVNVHSTSGADGIVGSIVPGILYVGAQNFGGVHMINTLVTPVVSSFHPSLPGIPPFHLKVIQQAPGVVGGPYLYGVAIDRFLTVRYEIDAVTGVPSNPVQVSFNGPAAATAPSTIIVSPFGVFFTHDNGPYNGQSGVIGTLTFSNGGLTGSLTSLPGTENLGGCYHAGFYDPFSDSVLFWGYNKICQLTSAGEFRSVAIPGVATFDQGTPDGLGHIFVADNGGGLFWFNYKASKDIRNFGNSGVLLHIGGLDDVAPLVGAGSAC